MGYIYKSENSSGKNEYIRTPKTIVIKHHPGIPRPKVKQLFQAEKPCRGHK